MLEKKNMIQTNKLCFKLPDITQKPYIMLSFPR